MRNQILDFPLEKLNIVDFIVEDETTTDKDLVNYYYQVIECTIPQSTREDALCREFIMTFESIVTRTTLSEDKKKIFIQYYKILAADAAYRNLLKRVGHLIETAH